MTHGAPDSLSSKTSEGPDQRGGRDLTTTERLGQSGVPDRLTEEAAVLPDREWFPKETTKWLQAFSREAFQLFGYEYLIVWQQIFLRLG